MTHIELVTETKSLPSFVNLQRAQSEIPTSSQAPPTAPLLQITEYKKLAHIFKQTGTAFLLLSGIFMQSFSSAWFPLSATRGHSMGLLVFVLPHNGSILPQQH